jgi:hypothetical protein
VTPRDRAALIAAAKPKARAVVNGVAAKNGRAVEHILGPLNTLELRALVVTLAAAADPVALAEVCAAGDDGRPDPGVLRARADRCERDRDRKRVARAEAAVAGERVRGVRVAARAAELRAEKQQRREVA